LPALAAGGGTENGGLRAALHLGAARHPGRRPHPPGRRAARPVPRKGLARACPRRDAGARPVRRRLRVPPQSDPAWAHDLPPETALWRVRIAPNVPLVSGSRPPRIDRRRLTTPPPGVPGVSIRAASP